MNSVHLQNVGQYNAAPAETFTVGDTMVWNFGQTSKVLEIVKETKTQIVFALESESGEVNHRRLNKSRMVGFL